jgi:hypothetical protein
MYKQILLVTFVRNASSDVGKKETKIHGKMLHMHKGLRNLMTTK